MSDERTREPQYQIQVTLRDTQGLTSLGLVTNQLWHDDPRHLLFLLAPNNGSLKLAAVMRLARDWCNRKSVRSARLILIRCLSMTSTGGWKSAGSLNARPTICSADRIPADLMRPIRST